jgi:hypothetical protein
VAELKNEIEMKSAWPDLLGRLLASSERQEVLLDELRSRLDSQDQKLHLHSRLLGLIADDTRFASDPKYRDNKHLGRIIAQISSQTTEDAVLAEIIERIGPGSKTFVEFGLENGRENTTRFLLEQQNWSGVWIEADPDHCNSIRDRFGDYIANGQLKLVEAFITAENINGLVKTALGHTEVDLLSVDIDRNTSHVWAAMNLKSRIAVVEYNAAVPPSIDWEIEYDPELVWDGSNVFGASLKALERIGRTKNMSLVGCDPRGINSFFVSNEEDLSKFRSPFDAQTHFEPVRFAMVETPRGHPRSD